MSMPERQIIWEILHCNENHLCTDSIAWSDGISMSDTIGKSFTQGNVNVLLEPYMTLGILCCNENQFYYLIELDHQIGS
jgi:hypothetical protein